MVKVKTLSRNSDGFDYKTHRQKDRRVKAVGKHAASLMAEHSNDSNLQAAPRRSQGTLEVRKNFAQGANPSRETRVWLGLGQQGGVFLSPTEFFQMHPQEGKKENQTRKQ